MEKREKTLVLLDSHAIIHRAYHALPEFLSSKGEPTGALYGLSSMLIRIITDLRPDYLVACYDLPGKTFRHEVYDEYKAGRMKADDALIMQLKNSREVFEAFSIPIYDAPGFEADDVIGTIVEKIQDSTFKNSQGRILNIDTIIASGDMDTMQLVDGTRVQVFTLKKGINDTIMYDEEEVVKRFSFKPEFLPDYKGLRGDPSDNIIGIKGIGEVTAKNLISKFGTIEKIYQEFEKDEKIFGELGLSERIVKLLKEGKEDALFSKTLATIRRDAPIKFALPEKTFWENASFEKIEKMFLKFEFKSLLPRLKSFWKGSTYSPQSALFIESNSEKIDADLLQETSIALWLVDSEISNPKLEDILSYAGTSEFETRAPYS
jgi:DNA polymerase-1